MTCLLARRVAEAPCVEYGTCDLCDHAFGPAYGPARFADEHGDRDVLAVRQADHADVVDRDRDSSRHAAGARFARDRCSLRQLCGQPVGCGFAMREHGFQRVRHHRGQQVAVPQALEEVHACLGGAGVAGIAQHRARGAVVRGLGDLRAQFPDVLSGTHCDGAGRQAVPVVAHTAFGAIDSQVVKPAVFEPLGHGSRAADESHQRIRSGVVAAREHEIKEAIQGHRTSPVRVAVAELAAGMHVLAEQRDRRGQRPTPLVDTVEHDDGDGQLDHAQQRDRRARVDARDGARSQVLRRYGAASGGAVRDRGQPRLQRGIAALGERIDSGRRYRCRVCGDARE